MIQAKNLHKYYDSLHVLKGVDLHIKKGEIVSIVGASGAGKTTLLQILGTLDHPDLEKGTELYINNEDILKMNDKNLSKFRNLNLGFIFQFHQLLPEFVTDSLRRGIKEFNKKMPGFITEDAHLIGVETRTSSPVRVCRRSDGQSESIGGIYPCGEGAGYAGGIISSALDGIKAAQNLINNLVS